MNSVETPGAPAAEADIDPGEVLAKMLDGRAIVPASDEVVAQRQLDEKKGRVRALRAEAGCPDRASRFLRESGSAWWVKNKNVAERRDLLARLCTQPGGATVVLYGPQGTGKTILAVDAIRTATADVRRCRFTTAVLLLCELSDAKAGGRIAAEMRFWVGVDVLVVDQLDKMARADWETRLLFDIFDARHNAERVTILVANGNQEELSGLLGASLIQRIQESGAAIPCDQRYRQKQ